MNKDFAEFQKWFKYFQKKFGLTGYKVYFKYEEVDGGYADITADQENMVVTVRLSSLPCKDRPIKQSAKHEAIHLLLHRLEDCAVDRFTTSKDIYSAAEEIVFKLEDLITD